MIKLFEICQNEEKFVYLQELQVLSEEAVTIRNGDCAASFMINRLRTERFTTEHLYALCMSIAMEVIAVIQISTGGVTFTCVPLDKVFQAALLTNVVSLILVHNHPSGKCIPSQEDMTVTSRLVEAGELIGVKIIDHLIVGDKEFYSIINKTGGKL